MDPEDVIYLVALLVSIGLGCIFQSIRSNSQKKWFSTVVGFAITALVCRVHILHILCSTLLMCVAINHHVLCFIIGFGYLVFFRATEYVGIPPPPGHANMIQMILTLKLIGLAFEIRDNDSLIKKMNDGSVETKDEDLYRRFPSPTLLDMFHYTFCYAGVLTGPYFTFRTYSDLFRYPRTEIKACFKETIKTTAYIPVIAVLHLVVSAVFPLQRLYTADFYSNTSFLYRLWSMYPAFFILRTRLYIAFKLSEGVCMMAGLGLYPADTKPKLGSGPSTNFRKLELPCDNYSFETILSVHVYECEFSYTVREATRHWNRSIQYWLVSYVYRRFPLKNQRTIATFFVSSLWHGMHAGYYFSLFSVPFYLVVEDTFRKRVIRNRNSKIKNVILWNAKMFQFSYWGLAFQLKSYEAVWNYGKSVYCMPYVVAVVMYLYALLQ